VFLLDTWVVGRRVARVVVILLVGAVVVVLLGGRVVVLLVSWVGVLEILVSGVSTRLHKSLVQMQACMVSDSTGWGEQVEVGSTGLSMEPSRILVGKHSRITAAQLEDRLWRSS